MQQQKVIIGKFGKTFGVHGWIKIHSFTNPPENIIHFSPWFIALPKEVTKDSWQEITNYKSQQNGLNIIVQLPNINTPEQAQFLVNQLIAIERTQLPAPSKDEFYWTDLIGCQVINTQNIFLGLVEYLFATASNDVMVVKSPGNKSQSNGGEPSGNSQKSKGNPDQKNGQNKKNHERFIPFLKDVILNVNLETKIITVDWDADF